MSGRALVVAALSGVLLAATQPVAPESRTIQLPGASAFDAALQARLLAAAAAAAARGSPRAEHRNADGSPQYVNRLVLASSPYLQQHAFNPVNWYPWGADAFAAAQREHKPIFLSIGYSTCHWCHVMERECFDNEAIARTLNEHFVAIKVDREERPDIDGVYVAAVQRMTGSAGWPLSLFLTPDGKPFYGGTYFPPEDLYGQPGFPKLLATLADAWKTRQDEVLQAGASLTAALQASAPAHGAPNLTADTLRTAYDQLQRSFDATNGGFGGAPKFPQAHQLLFLLRYWQRSGAEPARRMVTETLDHMARGGIHDQLGGGFHRYSTDARWLVPHFEKMLYDQAMDGRAYLDAYRATGDESAARTGRDILDYVVRDLQAPDGGFYAAEDADSEGEEGRFYLWSRDELVAALGPEAGPLIADFYGLADTDRRRPLGVPTPADEFAKLHHLEVSAFTRRLADARQLLLTVRGRRPHPLRDEKIITAWNGLMISSLARGSTVLADASYAAAAVRAADFILAQQRDGRLPRSYCRGTAATPAYLDDCAFFILGLGDLYDATLDVRWLREADRLARDMLRLFADPERGLRFVASDSEPLIAASDDPTDAALPSAPSVAALVLLHLGRLTMHEPFASRGRAVLAANAAAVTAAPPAFAEMLMALDFALGPTKEIVVAGPPDAPGTQALLAVIRHRYLPRSVLALHAPNDGAIEALVPFLKQQTMVNGKPTAYVCENYVCQLPTSDPGKLDQLLGPTRE